MYFVGYAAGQVLPTAVGGDAVRIIEHARRRPAAKADAAAAVLMERVLGSAGTLILVAVRHRADQIGVTEPVDPCDPAHRRLSSACGRSLVLRAHPYSGRARRARADKP